VPSGGLSVHLYSDLLKNIQPTANQLRRGAIIKDYIGNNAARKNARRKLNSYGYLVCHCSVVNSIESMKRMKEQLIMADLVAEIHHRDATDKELEKQQKNKAYDEKAPASVRKLEERGRDVGRLTVVEIESILFAVYNITLDGLKLRKTDYVSALEKEMTRNIGKYESFICLQQ
jgi:hypothetical protein